MSQVTLTILGKPVNFALDECRLEACKTQGKNPDGSWPRGKCIIKKDEDGGGKKRGPRSAIQKTVARARRAVTSKKKQQAEERKQLAQQLKVKMAAGEKFQIEADMMPEMMEVLKGAEPMNLAMMDVKGENNKNLFQHHLRDIPRKDMPALPATVAGMMPLIAELHRMGVEVEIVEMDPRELQYTQSELSAAKVAKMQENMKGGFMPGGGLLASEEYAIADGHHRAAGAAAASLMHELGVPGYSPVNVTVVRAKMPIDDLLAVAQRYSGERKSIAETP